MDDTSICASCLGSTIKVTRQSSGAECRLCTRPFAPIKWQVVGKNSTSKTVVCTTCAKNKRCCQVCMLDIDFHIPLDIRDTALEMAGLHSMSPRGGSDATTNCELQQSIADKLEERTEQDYRVRELLTKLATKLGEAKVQRSPLVKKNIILPVSGTFTTPQDHAISSFFLFGFPPTISKQLIIDNIPSAVEVIIKPRARCGFVKFANHEAALNWAGAICNSKFNVDKLDRPALLLINGVPMRVSWSPVIDLGDDDENLARQVNVAMVQAARPSTKPLSVDHERISKPNSRARLKKETNYSSLNSEL